MPPIPNHALLNAEWTHSLRGGASSARGRIGDLTACARARAPHPVANRQLERDLRRRRLTIAPRIATRGPRLSCGSTGLMSCRLMSSQLIDSLSRSAGSCRQRGPKARSVIDKPADPGGRGCPSRHRAARDDRQLFAANWDALSHVLVAAPLSQSAEAILGGLITSLVPGALRLSRDSSFWVVLGACPRSCSACHTGSSLWSIHRTRRARCIC